MDITIPAKNGRFVGKTLEKQSFKTYPYEVKDIKIVTLSENQSGYSDDYYKNSVSYNAAGKYYEYKGHNTLVAPKVTKVTATINGEKNVDSWPRRILRFGYRGCHDQRLCYRRRFI